MITPIPPKMLAIVEKGLPPAEKCYLFLKEAILTGYFKRGQHIVERDIIVMLSVSRTPLREALRKLEKETLVEHSPNKGCTVVGFSGQDIVEIYELRKVLECFMLREVAANVRCEELLELRQEVVERKEGRGSREEYWSFHLQMLRLTRNRWLNTMLGQLEEYIRRFHVLSFLRGGREEQAYQEHLAIVDALLEGDVERAEAVLKQHLDESYKAFETIQALI